ncbi:MAG: flagellin lysine-N-methylase [Lachnospiraceae bacterium]|nr:flagellin lysine-N-methylase [Lachnospiraceae bacterium]
MLYVRPDYYEKFKCIADRCEATCCAGWQIVIDEGAMECYKSQQGEYGEVLRERIDWSEGVFKQDCRKRCAFLKDNNLCEMYERLGEVSLCFTCANYPRHIEEFENLREVTLTISCPEVARILLEQKEPVKFTEEEIDTDEEEFEDFDLFFFSYLEDARKIMIAILQKRSLSVAVRVSLVQKMAEEMQTIIEGSDLFDLADVFDTYEEEANLAKAVSEAEQELEAFYENKLEIFFYSKTAFERLYKLEFLSEDWEAYLDKCRETLYGEDVQGYHEMQKKFGEYCARTPIDGIDMDILLEQLLVYFVFAYFCGAVYDDNVIGKIRMAVDSVTVLYEMFMAKWVEQDGRLSAEDIQRIVYRYSRELEHSDVNLGIMQR